MDHVTIYLSRSNAASMLSVLMTIIRNVFTGFDLIDFPLTRGAIKMRGMIL